MRGRVLLVVAAGAVAGLLAAPAGAGTTPPLSFEMTSGSSSVYCAATQPATVSKSGQSCSIVQPAGGTAWCIERISKRGPTPVVQTCTIKQASTWKKNVAIVVQLYEAKGGGSPQDGTQNADVRQGNQFNANEAYVTQITKQLLGHLLDSEGDYEDGDWIPDATVLQDQKARISAVVCQGGRTTATDPANCRTGAGMVSSNKSSVIQQQWQSEQAKGTEVTQEQNTTFGENTCAPEGDATLPDTDANMCANVDQQTQTVGGGKNDSNLGQLYVQLQRARAETTTQRQGGSTVDTGGLDHTVNQLGPRPSSIHTGQHSFQIQRVNDAVVLVRKQDPRISKGFGSSQGTSPESVWRGRQTAVQLQFEDGVLGGDTQTARLEYFGTTSGNIEASQLINQNGETETNSCSGTTCAAVLECTTVEEEEDYYSWESPPTQFCTVPDVD
jgi:hypothetical protein